MTWRGPRRGFFEAIPRIAYRRGAERYVGLAVAGASLNGAVVALAGVVVVVLYVDLRPGEAAALAGVWAIAFALEGGLAGRRIHLASRPAQRWIAGGRDPALARGAWDAMTRLSPALQRDPLPYAAGVAGCTAIALLLAGQLDLTAPEAALALPVVVLTYASSVILRLIALDLALRPVLRDIGEHLEEEPPVTPGASLHSRLLTAIPMVTWGAAIVAGGLLSDDSSDLDTLGLAGVLAFALSAALSLWLSLVLADSVSGPLRDLRDATRRVSGGDLDTRVPVVTVDETGELSASFNAMVAGLGERARLREAFGAFVDPSLTERVIAEGTDLRGELVEVSVLFCDVRGFTAFAETAAPEEVVARLNALYEAVVPVITRCGGHANKFAGDGLMAVFGAPDRHPDHAERAVAAALEIAVLNRAGDLRVGVGVNSGPVVAGTIGGGGRRDFTVVGDVVNTAARVEAATRDSGDDVLITRATLEALGDAGAGRFAPRPPVALKGKSATVALYAPAGPAASARPRRSQGPASSPPPQR